jgi:two-component system chemotaxis response regulator CheB
MPQSALTYVAVDYRLPMSEMAAVLDGLAREPLAEEGEAPMSEALAIETKIALEDNALQSGVLRLGQPSYFTCPECHGMLVQIQEGEIIRFRCHTGHAYSQETLLAEVDESVELGLWNAVRTMDEKVLLLRHMAQQLTTPQDAATAQRLTQKAADVEQRSQVVRQLVLSHQRTSAAGMAQGEEVDSG